MNDPNYAPAQDEDQDPLVAVEVEAALLGAMLTDNTLIATYAGQLKADDFAEGLHGRIFGAMLRFYAKGMNANSVTLRPVFQNDPSALGGDYLDKITDSGALVVGARDFVAQILLLSSRRRVRLATQKALERLNTDFESPIAEIAAGVQDAAWANDEVDEAPSSMPEQFARVSARHQRIEAGGGSTGATNKFVSDLDKGLGPLEPGTYTIFAGRPGMGKSILASSAALGYAVNGHAGLYLHAEMTPEQMALRQMSDLSFALGKAITHNKLKKNDLDAAERQWKVYTEERAALLPLRTKSIKGWNIRRVEALVAREQAILAAQGQVLEFFVVDYLQLLEADIDGRYIDDDRKRTNAISKTFRNMCDRLGVAGIALSQLSRDVEKRPDKRPTLSDLRESGNLEQDADAVLLLFREEYYHEQSKPKAADRDSKGNSLLEAWEKELEFIKGKVDLIVGKNRHDARMTKTANFIGKYTAIRGGDVDVVDDGYAQPILFEGEDWR